MFCQCVQMTRDGNIWDKCWDAIIFEQDIVDTPNVAKVTSAWWCLDIKQWLNSAGANITISGCTEHSYSHRVDFPWIDRERAISKSLGHGSLAWGDCRCIGVESTHQEYAKLYITREDSCKMLGGITCQLASQSGSSRWPNPVSQSSGEHMFGYLWLAIYGFLQVISKIIQL